MIVLIYIYIKMRLILWFLLLLFLMVVMIIVFFVFVVVKFNCEKFFVDGYIYNFKEFLGLYMVVMSEFFVLSYYNMMYMIDLCGGLKLKIGGERERCFEGMRGEFYMMFGKMDKGLIEN